MLMKISCALFTGLGIQNIWQPKFVLECVELQYRNHVYKIRLQIEIARDFFFVLLRSFSPFWQVLKALAEKLSLLHQQLLTSWQELLKDVQKYNTDQQKKHREVLHCFLFVYSYSSKPIVSFYWCSFYAFIISSHPKI